MRAGWIAVAAAALASTTPAEATHPTAAELSAYCESVGFPDRLNYCWGYMAGVWDMREGLQLAMRVSSTVCLPPQGISRAQMADIFVGYLRVNPVDFSSPAPIAMVKAFEAAFPCAQN